MTVTEFPGGVRVEGAEPFDLAQTLDCGQCFRFAPTGDGGWFGAAGGHAVGLRFEGESLVLEGATAAEFEGFWRDYLDLDRTMRPSGPPLPGIPGWPPAWRSPPVSGC